MREFEGSIGRTGWGLGSLLLAGVASSVLTTPAEALTIVPTFSGGVSSSARTAFNAVAAEYDTQFTNPITINIAVDTSTSVSLGESSTALIGVLNYSSVRSALTTEYATAPSAARTTATGPGGSINTTTDPTAAFNGGTGGHFFLSTAEGKALGLSFVPPAEDGTFIYNPSLMYTFNHTAATGKFDFQGVAEHEVSEIMGRIPGLGTTALDGSSDFLPYDLFRYTGANTRGITNTGAGNYFSVNNGTTNLHGYNNANANGGDPQDWDSSNPADSYDAFLSTNQATMITPVDIEAMNILGYNLATVPAPPIGHGLPVLLGFGVVLFGAKLYGRSKKKGILPLEAQGSLSLGT